MRLLSWNLRKSPQSRAEVAAVVDLRPDVVVLQGLVAPSWPLFQWGLAEVGLAHAERLGDLAILSRWPIDLLPTSAHTTGWLAVRLEHEAGVLDLHTARVPAGKPEDPRALELLDGLFHTLSLNSDVPRLLAADLQAPDVETPDGAAVCWPGRHWDERARVVHARRWQLVRGLEPHGWHDAFRALHPSAPAWSHQRFRRGRDEPWRPDHLLAAGPLRVPECAYLPELRRPQGHAPLLAKVWLDAQVWTVPPHGWHAGWQWEDAVATHWRGRPLPDAQALEDEGGGWWVRGSFEDFEAGTFTLEWARAWDRFDPREYDYAARCWSEDEALDFHRHENRVRRLAETQWIQPQTRGRLDLRLAWIEPDLPE